MSQNPQSSLDVRLQPIAEGDLPMLRAWRNDPSIFKWCRQAEPISEKHHRAWFESLHGDESRKMYAIYRTKSSQLLGVCGLTSIDWVNRRAEFSLYIGPEHQGNRYGEIALRRLLRIAFGIFNLHTVWGESFEGNPAAVMFKKVGFQFEGTRRRFYFREGQYVDAHLWSILRDEFVG